MNDFIIYLIRSAAATTIFYGFYMLFIKKQGDFIFNRFYLLISLLLAVFIPLISFPDAGTGTKIATLQNISSVNLNQVLIGLSKHSMPSIKSMPIYNWLSVIYYTVVFLFTILFFKGIFGLIRLRNKSEINYHDKMTIIFISSSLPVFSFFRWVFIPKEIYKNPAANAILEHEKIHMNQYHSLDLLLVEILGILQWFNPFIYLIKKEIKENHEFIADEAIYFSGENINHYQQLLFQQASGLEFSPITNNFSYSLLKKRIIMMKRSKMNKIPAFKFLFAAAAISVTLMACNQTKNKPAPEKANDTKVVAVNTQKSYADEPVFTTVAHMPSFPGGEMALMKYLAENIKYPAEAKKAGIKGRVFVHFIVEPNGKVDNIKILKGIGHGCDKEVIRVMEKMPKWVPGRNKDNKPVRTSFNLPVKFSLN